MNSFPLMALAECCEIVSGATPSTSVEEYWDGEVCWATPKDLSDLDGHYISDTPRKLTAKGLNSCAASILPPNSVLFSSRAPIGHVAINTVPMATNQGFKSLVPKADKIDAKFLFYWLRANRSYLESLGVGATFKEVSKAIVSKIKTPVPPLPEQRRIAAILDQADALRTKRREALAQLDSLTQAIFIEMFGDPVTNPKGWPVVLMESITERITKGESPNWQGFDYQDEGVLFVTSENVKLGELDLTKKKFVPAAFHEKLGRSKLQKNDLLVNLVGASIGRSCLFKGWEHSANVNQAVGVVRAIERLVTPTFLIAFLTSSHGQQILLGNRVEGARANISLTDLREIEVPLPPISAQEKFAERVSTIQKIALEEGQSMFELEALFASLQHRAFRGEL